MPDPVFFAIFPDGDAAARIARLAQRLRDGYGLKGTPLAPARFHVSLHHLGDYEDLPQGVIAAASEAAASVALPPFDVAFDRAMSFSGGRGDRPLVLLGGDGVAALTAFHRVLGLAMKKAGLGRWVAPRYTPHMTLLYGGDVAEQTVETIGWTVREFVLVQSLIGQARHVPLGRWPLRG